MKVSETEAVLYFDLMWALQHFVNAKRQVISPAKTPKTYEKRKLEDKLKVRETLFADITLIDEFVQENPQKLSQEKLKIVSGWKNFTAGKFYIERLLKKHAIFIAGENVYGVQGLLQGLDEIVPSSYLPVCTQAILLPFKGRIIYDGILQPYNVFFGNGIKADLKEVYMNAKHNGTIITRLEPDICQRALIA